MSGHDTLFLTTDPKRIAEYEGLVNRHLGGWVEAGEAGASDTEVQFWAGDKYLGKFGYFRDYLVVLRSGRWWAIKTPSATELAEVKDMLARR